MKKKASTYALQKSPLSNQSKTSLLSNSIRDKHHNDASLDPYIAGFVDGEGCFSISFRKLNRLKVGIEVRPSFSVGQRKTDENYKLLSIIRERLKGGSIRVDRTGKEMYKYETRSLSHIRENVIPFFEQHRLRSEKRFDFSIFCKICSLVADKQHLNSSGLDRIFDLVKDMNSTGKRRVSISSLHALLMHSTDKET